MLDHKEFRIHVIRPALKIIGLHSDVSEALMLGTALSESRLIHLVQGGGGPALGLYQVEPATHADIWDNFLRYRSDLTERVKSLMAGQATKDQLIWNLWYATAIARIVYYRKPASLPETTNVGALAAYWKTHYNTVKGKGTVEHFISSAGPYLGTDGSETA